MHGIEFALEYNCAQSRMGFELQFGTELAMLLAIGAYIATRLITNPRSNQVLTWLTLLFVTLHCVELAVVLGMGRHHMASKFFFWAATSAQFFTLHAWCMQYVKKADLLWLWVIPALFTCEALLLINTDFGSMVHLLAAACTLAVQTAAAIAVEAIMGKRTKEPWKSPILMLTVSEILLVTSIILAAVGLTVQADVLLYASKCACALALLIAIL